ncbi:DUF3883 domain-containing protein [Salinimicrobium xinjiangense]|uniref:DUF3883 domain-containing protein n=1 Tax=Salinimicrobium xinjiangense TaxID=438596 RepID=UPI00042438C4|nr:DUF3883 domain-containing protein [Salinimicrobium xinjiangense]
MNPITNEDLKLVNSLSARTYSGNQLLSNASEEEKKELNKIKLKLKNLAAYFSAKYSESYGPFETSVVTGNDIAIRGTTFKRMWSGIFKGGRNKQYAAQISFVMNPKENCLDVGFYFGRAASHSKSKEEKIRLEKQLKNLATSLTMSISLNDQFRERYFLLYDLGFKYYSKDKIVAPEVWYQRIPVNAKTSQIVVKVFPNDFNVIENSTIDFFVSQLIFLMGGIEKKEGSNIPMIKPMTPEQRAKQAERLTEIGTKGEIYVMKKESEKLKMVGLPTQIYPKHVALESSAYGYDVLSIDETGKEIYIEVKTTTRPREDFNSKQFYISSNEYEVYEKDKSKYKLYRVYDIENSPSIEEVNLEDVRKRADGYVCEY